MNFHPENNFFNLLEPGIEPPTLGLQGQFSTPTPLLDLCYSSQNITGSCQQIFENKNAMFCLTPQANFPANNLDFHRKVKVMEIQSNF